LKKEINALRFEQVPVINLSSAAIYERTVGGEELISRDEA